jgi:hypothetical protein
MNRCRRGKKEVAEKWQRCERDATEIGQKDENANKCYKNLENCIIFCTFAGEMHYAQVPRHNNQQQKHKERQLKI